jgi:type IV pilus assembly protein PilY1
MNVRSLGSIAFTVLAALLCCTARAQAPVSENFTGATTTNQWIFYNGACLTAGSSAVSGGIGVSTTGGYTFPGCVGIASSYYATTEDGSQDLVGGVDGYLGSSSAPSTPSQGVPDPVGQGALRFTNGYPNGHGQNGVIVSGWTFPTNQGIQVQFETVTYRGDSGGNGASCPSGSSASNGQCISTTTVAATATYSCPSGYTLSGTTCSETETTPPTKNGNNYTCPAGYTKSGSGASTTCTKTVTVAATATYSCSSGYTLSGSNCSETTVVLATDPHQNDGADGISFFLMDGSQPVSYDGGTVGNYGSWGGSLGYSCSNTNTPYNGLVGAYIGLGIDEYGNFLNGKNNTLGVTDAQALGDNTASGGGQWANRIGLRGTGNVSWYWLNANYPTYYPSSLTTAQQETAVQSTCETGTLWNYSSPSAPTNSGETSISSGPVLYDYPAIPNAWQVLPAGVQIASETATARTLCAANATSDNGCVMPIVYNLKITPAGLLSLSYSVNGGATQQVLTNQLITASNGPLPSTFRFGFAGSTGGSTNIHEVLCFQAQPSSLSEGSAGVNQQPSAKIESGSGAFAYFTYYDPDNWTGRLTANQLNAVTSGGVTTLEVVSTPTWDASCVLTGGACASTGGTDTVEGPSSRTILTWNGTEGAAFEWADLSSAEQSAMDSGDPSGETEPGNRVAFLRGDRTNEVNSSGSCTAASLSPAQTCYRERDGVLGDIVDSSPTWVGPPSSPYTATWADRLYASTTMPENTGTQNYTQYVTADETRENVVYVGANDGLLHGFRSGAFNANGTFNTSAPNDGEEVLAYMPGATIQGAVLNAGTTCSTGGYASGTSVVDTIHGTNPASCNGVTTNLDFSNTQYGHNFYVDATPGSGDLFYNGTWHTWLVGGLGAGGAVIYALDVTNPGSVTAAGNFSESNAATLVMGEWSPATISCTNVTTSPGCGQDLGNTYGTPQIRRLHSGTWGVIFGNGFGSVSGDAGIFIVTVSSSGTSVPTYTTYYLSTGTAGTGNGIAYVTPADLDGDHITDYVYAGDLKGNVWRFDLTSSNPANWGITRCLDAACDTTSTAPLFTTSSGQPITSQLVVASGQTAAGAQTLIIAFGTGQKSPFTNTGSTSFATGTQAIYGVWDWAMANWNSKSATQYAALTPTNTGLSSPYTLTYTSLAEQQFTVNTSGCSSNPPGASCGDRDITANATVCWTGTSACSGSGTNDQFGWYVTLPGGTSQLPEQVVFSPELVNGAFVVNSTVPPSNTLLSCTVASQTGYTYALQVLSGGAFNNFFPLYNDYVAAGVATNATGTSFPVQTANGESWLVYQTYQPGATPPAPLQINTGANSTGHRITWTELR